jgi:hypothetical protein
MHLTHFHRLHSTARRLSGLVAAAALAMATPCAMAAGDKPNILVVWGDDIGQSNISYFTHGLVGYETPNIDRIAGEGMTFTDYYGEQSCTAGRSSFIMGQSVFRTGLSKVGLPGAKLGMREEEPTIAGLLKAQGYATGQFGKTPLGDRDEHLPTNHGFEEFFGNLYHLNAEEEPENEDYPGDLELPNGKTFLEQFGPRGVIHSWAQPDGTQKIEDTGPLTTRPRRAPSSSSRNSKRPASRGSSGGAARACTSAPISRRSCAAFPARTSTPTAWSSTTATSACSWTPSTISALPTTPSSSTPPTTAHT